MDVYSVCLDVSVVWFIELNGYRIEIQNTEPKFFLISEPDQTECSSIRF